MFHSNVTLFAKLLKVIVCKIIAQVHLQHILICINLENLNVEFVVLSLIFKPTSDTMFNLVKCFLYDIRFVIVIYLYSTGTLLKSELVCWNLNELGGGKCYAPGSCPNMFITNLLFPFFY